MSLKKKWEYPFAFWGLVIRQRIESKHVSDSKLNAAHQEARHEESATHLKKKKRTTTVILPVKQTQIFSNLYFSNRMVLFPQ